MIHEVVLTRTIVDSKGFDRNVTERYYTENCIVLAESEAKALEEFNNECDVVSVKVSKLKEFVNTRESEEQKLFIATLESVFIDEQTGEEKITKYNVAVFSDNVEKAMKVMVDYQNQGLNDLRLAGIKKSNFKDIL